MLPLMRPSAGLQTRTARRCVPALLLATLLAACGPSAAPEQAVRQWLADAQAAAEDRDRERLIGMVSPGYGDARGNDRDDIDRMLRLIFLRQQKVLLVSKVDELALVGNPAEASAATVSLTVGDPPA
jgi:hypothetical protein